METDEICTKTVSSMITDSIMMIDVECPPLPQEVDRTRLDSRMIDAITAASVEHQLTQESRALMRDLSSFKVWLTGTERIEKVMTKIIRLAVECTF